MYQWKKDIVQWKINKVLYLSIPFTWLLPKAKTFAELHKGKVIAGGPAVDLMPDYVSKFAIVEKESPIPPLHFHNPCATFTTRGCPNKCSFCAVPKIEGDFKELKNFEIKPIICDNNFLASSKKHFNNVIDKLKKLPFVDFNQGLDARLFKNWHADRIAELKSVHIRFSFDRLNMEKYVVEAINISKKHKLSNIGIYVLIGYKDTYEEAVYKLNLLSKLKVMTFPMRYQSLDCLEKNSFLSKNWTLEKLVDIQQFFSTTRVFGYMNFRDYNKTREKKRLF